MRLVLGSGGHGVTGAKKHLIGAIVQVFKGTPSGLFIPYAGKEEDFVTATREWVELWYNGHVPIDPINESDDPAEACRQARGFFVDGGNTFRLQKKLLALGLLDIIRHKVLHGAPYMGVSAGTNIACPTIQTTNDMPIVCPESMKALGLVPFQINTHYVDPHDKSVHRGETRDERIAEYLQENAGPVLALREGALIVVIRQRVYLRGVNGGKLFLKGETPKELTPRSKEITALLPSIDH